MKRFLRIGLLICGICMFSAAALAGPPWPPVLWGYERVFYNGSGEPIGGIVACPDNTSSWGSYTNSYQDFPTNCP